MDNVSKFQILIISFFSFLYLISIVPVAMNVMADTGIRTSFGGARIGIGFGVTTADFFLHGTPGVLFPFFVSPGVAFKGFLVSCLLYTSPSPRD